MRVLIGDIVGGALPPGSALPREADLAARFGVSRGVARESLRGLEERGLVTVKHGRGATVNPDAQWDVFDPDVLAALLDGDQGAEILTRVPRVPPDPRDRGGVARRRAGDGDRPRQPLGRVRADVGRRRARARQSGRRGPVPRGRRGVPPGADRRHRQPRAREHDRARCTARSPPRGGRSPAPSTGSSAGCPSTGGSWRRSPAATPPRRAPRCAPTCATVEGYLREYARGAASEPARAGRRWRLRRRRWRRVLVTWLGLRPGRSRAPARACARRACRVALRAEAGHAVEPTRSRRLDRRRGRRDRQHRPVRPRRVRRRAAPAGRRARRRRHRLDRPRRRDRGGRGRHDRRRAATGRPSPTTRWR